MGAPSLTILRYLALLSASEEKLVLWRHVKLKILCKVIYCLQTAQFPGEFGLAGCCRPALKEGRDDANGKLIAVFFT